MSNSPRAARPDQKRTPSSPVLQPLQKSQNRLHDGIRGALIGSAIGDAFAIRTEFMHYKDIEAQYGRVEHFEWLPPRRPSTEPRLESWNPFGSGWTRPATTFHPLGIWSDKCGAYTDDTRYRLIAYAAMLRRGGPINGLDLARIWLDYRLAAEGAGEADDLPRWPGPEREYARLLSSVERLAELAQQRRPCRPGWDGPMGVMHAGDPTGAASQGYAMAVAVAAALAPDSSVDSVMTAVLEHADVFDRWEAEFRGRVERLLMIAARCTDVYDLRAPFYHEYLIPHPPFEAAFALEMVPCALALVAAARGNARQAILGAANMGRDADTIASMAGELAGALGGADALPAEWVERILSTNPQPDLEAYALRLTDIVTRRAHAQAGRVAGLLAETDRLPKLPG